MIKYLIYTFGITWALWGTVILGINLDIWEYGHPIAMTCYVTAILGPGISAYIVNRKQCSSQEVKNFTASIIKVKHPIKWYIWVIALPICITSLPLLTGGSSIGQPFYMGFIMIIPMIIGGGIEEIGWRGFLQSRLETRFSVLTSTLILACIWAIWHIPLWFIPWTNQSDWSFIFFCVNVTCFSFLLAGVFHKTKSIFLCIICHATINAFWAVFPTKNRILPMIPGLLISLFIMLILTDSFKKKTF